MLPYTSPPTAYVKSEDVDIASFLKPEEVNIDWETVASFGDEWNKFNSFSTPEIENIGADYFDIVTDNLLNQDTVVLDVGCGSGRWIKFVAPKVKYVEGIDPSHAVVTAATFLSSHRNVRITQASVENIPFADQAFDFVYSLGVLHHVPEPQSAIQRCHEKLKPRGWFLLYLYYDLENRSAVYKSIFKVSSWFRARICRLPRQPKRLVCEGIAVFIYWPLSMLSLFISIFSKELADQVPLGYYRKTSFLVMRNDALDRFGTSLEKRFSKSEILKMLESAGFSSIQFSNQAPYWHVLAQKN